VNDQLKSDAEQFAAFLVEHYEPARTWCDPVGYCAWNISKGYIAVVVDDENGNGEIVAMCAMRPVDRPGFGVLPFYSNDKGKCLHIDLLVDISDDLRAITAFRCLFWYRFGPRETITLFRGNEQSIHCYPYNKFWHAIARIKKVERKKENRHGTEIATVTA
jgi:hypothetical protein